MGRTAITLTGSKDLQRKLNLRGERVWRKHTKRALRAGARPIVREAKARIEPRSGATKKSLGVVVREYESSQVMIAVIGPRSGYEVEIDGKTHDPAAVGHLIEFGHEGPMPAPAYPFMRPAFDEKVDTANRAMVVEMAKGLSAEARK